MRIGIDYRPVVAAPYSGIARQVIALEKALTEGGAELLRFTAAPLEHPIRNEGFCPEWGSPSNGLHRPIERIKFEVFFLPKAIKDANLDLYIATANTGLPAWHVSSKTRYALLLHDVFQLTMENYHANKVKAMVYRFIDWLSINISVKQADVIWTPSAYTASEAAKLFKKHSNWIEILPNAVPTPESADNFSIPPGLPFRYWLIVGTREPRKNIAWFVENWRQARCEHSDIPGLVLVGHQQDIPEEQRNLPGLSFINGIGDTELQALYAHAEYLWQPSRAEGFGLPVIEALGQGTPVAVAQGSALDEVAPPNAPRFSPDDGTALQALMLHLAASSDKRDREMFKDWAKRYAMDEYSQRVWRSIKGLCQAGNI